MQESKVKVLGFDHLKDLYEINVDFQEYFDLCRNRVNKDSSPWKDLMLQDDFFIQE